MMSDSDDDPIVSEIPVYLNQDMKNQLYLLQYTSNPVKGTSPEILSVKVKPENKEVQIEIGMNADNPNYDRGRGEYIAKHVDGPSCSKNQRMFISGMMDKIVLESNCSVADAGRYAVGILENGELHLNPLHTCLQMRNCLSYLDKGDQRVKEAVKSHLQEEGEEEEMEHVTVKFAKETSEKKKRVQANSFEVLRKKRSEEPWHSTQYFPSTSQKSEFVRSRLFCQTPQEQPMELTVDSELYCELLAPAEDLNEQTYGTQETSLRRLRKAPLVARVRHLLRSASVLGYDELVTLLDCSDGHSDVLRAIEQVAVLVQGNWVIRSEEVFPTNGSYSPGITSKDLCHARDYMLLQFNKKMCIPMCSLRNNSVIPIEELIEIVQKLAEKVPTKGWRFKVPCDESFGRRFPEVYRRQNFMWEARMKNI